MVPRALCPRASRPARGPRPTISHLALRFPMASLMRLIWRPPKPPPGARGGRASRGSSARSSCRWPTPCVPRRPSWIARRRQAAAADTLVAARARLPRQHQRRSQRQVARCRIATTCVSTSCGRRRRRSCSARTCRRREAAGGTVKVAASPGRPAETAPRVCSPLCRFIDVYSSCGEAASRSCPLRPRWRV